MIDAVFTFDKTLDAYAKQIEETPKAVHALLNGSIRNYLTQRMDTELGYEPPPVFRPIEWTTPFQQVMFFKTNGFGRGIPTKRMNTIINSWEVVIDLANTSAGLLNNHPAAQYVIGHRQQRFHANTGYHREDKIALHILTSPDFEDILIDGWLSIVDFKGTLA